MAVGAYDGRVARGERTRTSILEATIDLIQTGTSRPTARQVADHAGVSVRVLFHHFADVGTIFQRAAELHADRSRTLIGIIPARGPVDFRVAAICHQRRELFEAIAPVLRAAQARTTADQDVVVGLRGDLRHQLLVGLRPEIVARGKTAPFLLESLGLATGWRNWTSLRFDDQRSADQAEQVMVYTASVLVH